MNTTIARALPLVLALGVVACGTKPDTTTDKTGDTDVASNDTDTGSGDSGGSSGFAPIEWDFQALFGIDADGLPRDIMLGSNTWSPAFEIDLVDSGGDMCSLIYTIHEGNYAFAAQGGDTDTSTGNADVLTWMDAHSVDFGFQVKTGEYDAQFLNTTGNRCADLTVDYLNGLIGNGAAYTDVHEAALYLGEATGALFFGLNSSPTQESIDWAKGGQLVESTLLGGALTLPYSVGSGASKTDTFDGIGLFATIDGTGAPANDGSKITWADATDAYDNVKKQPNEGAFQYISPSIIKFSSN